MLGAMLLFIGRSLQTMVSTATASVPLDWQAPVASRAAAVRAAAGVARQPGVLGEAQVDVRTHQRPHDVDGARVGCMSEGEREDVGNGVAGSRADRRRCRRARTGAVEGDENGSGASAAGIGSRLMKTTSITCWPRCRRPSRT